MNNDEIDRLLGEIRQLARQAQAVNREWRSANSTCPSDERQVLVFLNGHVELGDVEGHRGGGWGIRMGFFDHDKRCWYGGGVREKHVTHWMELPEAPPRPGKP